MPSHQQLKRESRAVGLLLSEDAMLAGIWVQIELPDGDSRTVLEAVGAVRQTVDSAVDDLPVSPHYTGTLALNEAYIDVVRHDLTRIVPLLLLGMMVVLRWLLRSSRAVLTMLPVGICSVVAAFGIVGVFGAELAAINSFVPIIDLHQESYWLPDAKAKPPAGAWSLSGSGLRIYHWVHIGFGWLLSFLFVAGLSGLVRKD